MNAYGVNMTSEPLDSSFPAQGHSGRPPTLTVADSDGRIRAALARAAYADAIRISNGQTPAFGSIREMIIAEVDDTMAALESGSHGEEVAPSSTPQIG